MNALERAWTKLSFRGQKKVRILRQLQRLIKSGVTLQKALTDIRLIYSKKGRKPKEPLAMMIGEWQAKLKAGKSLSQSMHGWVSTAEEMIIEAGEQSEQLASSLEDAMTANGAASKIKKAIIGGLIIGVGEKLSEVYLGPYVGGGIEIWFAYVLALVFLLFRPQGLFGEKIIDRV